MRLSGALAVLACLTSGDAFASCEAIPKPVKSYLADHPKLHLVTVSDLGPDDQQLWQQYHRGLCPGLASVDLDGSGRNSYALTALTNTTNGEAQRLILLQHGKAPQIIVKSTAARSVVWRAKPGMTRDVITGKRTLVPHDSFVFEAMESAARTYYLRSGKIKLIWTSD
jgi:hypothetical protein